MTALSRQSSNPNFLSPLGFKVQIHKTPNLNFFAQSVSIPNVTLGEATVDTPFSKIPFPGTRLTFGNLSIKFKVDEDLANYREIFGWMRGLGFPDNFEQYSTLAAQPVYSGEGVFSDITVVVLSSAMNPNYQFDFFDCFPVDLSGIELDSTSADVEYLTATVTFANRRFDIKKVT